jgi:hypothetical protein
MPDPSESTFEDRMKLDPEDITIFASEEEAKAAQAEEAQKTGQASMLVEKSA